MNDDRTRLDPSPKGPARSAEGESTADAAWGVFSYLIAGLLAYGGLGWLVGALTHQVTLCVTIGVVVGIALATTTVFLRYGRQAATVPVRQRSVSLRGVRPAPIRSAAAATAGATPAGLPAASAADTEPDGEQRHKPKPHVIDQRETEHAS